MSIIALPAILGARSEITRSTGRPASSVSNWSQHGLLAEIPCRKVTSAIGAIPGYPAQTPRPCCRLSCRQPALQLPGAPTEIDDNHARLDQLVLRLFPAICRRHANDSHLLRQMHIMVVQMLLHPCCWSWIVFMS